MQDVPEPVAPVRIIFIFAVVYVVDAGFSALDGCRRKRAAGGQPVLRIVVNVHGKVIARTRNTLGHFGRG